MGKTAITVEIDTGNLGGYEDRYLAMLWHVAQANPADGFTDKAPGELAERIGREIIRRWLGQADVELYHHQGHHYYWELARQQGRWIDGQFVPNVPADAQAQ